MTFGMSELLVFGIVEFPKVRVAERPSSRTSKVNVGISELK